MNKIYSCVLLRFVLVLVSLSQFQFLSAQKSDEQTDKETPQIYLGAGAKIVSGDEIFNQQIIQEKIQINGSPTFQKGKSQILIVAKTKKQKSSGTDFLSQAKAAQKKKREKDLKAVQEKLADFEKRKAVLQNNNFHIPSSSNHFFSTQQGAREFALLTNNTHDLSKIKVSAYFYTLQLSSVLDDQKHVFYNSRSLNDCYARFFSGRSPPFLI